MGEFPCQPRIIFFHPAKDYCCTIKETCQSPSRCKAPRRAQKPKPKLKMKNKTDINIARNNINSGRVAYVVGKQVWRIYGSTELGTPQSPDSSWDNKDEAEAACIKDGLLLVTRYVADQLIREWCETRAFALRLFVMGQSKEAMRVLGK